MKAERIKHNGVKYDESDGKGRVFISYQRNSLSFVLSLSDFLEKNGVYTWYAPRNIRISAKWPEKLYEAIANCKALLLLYTDEADKSKHVMREVNIADSEDKPIIWMRLDNSQPSKTLKYFLSLIQSIDYESKKKEEIEYILLNILNKDPISVNGIIEDKELKLQNSTKSLEQVDWSNGIYAFNTADEASECAARVYFGMAEKRPESTLLLPTGRSAKSIFYSMIRIVNEYPQNPFGSTYLMNDTETFGVMPSNSTSRIKAINDFLITPLKNMGKSPKESQLHFYCGISAEIEPEIAAAKNLEEFPPSCHGISVSPYCEVLGYDLGAHDASIVNDKPCVVKINDETKEYIEQNQKTNYLYTVGMGTALKAELLMILAFDKDKSSAIERLFKEEIDPCAPITLLRNHKNAYVIITKEIARKSNLKNTIEISPKEAAKLARQFAVCADKLVLIRICQHILVYRLNR